jgi:hypothetical protein
MQKMLFFFSGGRCSIAFNAKRSRHSCCKSFFAVGRLVDVGYTYLPSSYLLPRRHTLLCFLYDLAVNVAGVLRLLVAATSEKSLSSSSCDLLCALLVSVSSPLYACQYAGVHKRPSSVGAMLVRNRDSVSLCDL